MKKKWLLALALLPGTSATLFMVVAIANGGTLFGVSLNWLIRCDWLAIPMSLAILLVIITGAAQKNKN